MTISERDLESFEPVRAECTEDELIVTLIKGQKIVTPLWWYPRLMQATPAQRAKVELLRYGVHWPDVDEDLSVEGMLVGARAPGAKEPNRATGADL